jgi:flagellar motor switch protein FliG
MTPLSPSLRKAAILISALDEQAADVILQAMSPDEAATIRSALVELDDIPADEQRRVLAEFLRQQGLPALSAEFDDDVALELSAVVEARASEYPTKSPGPSLATTPSEQPLAFLAKAPAAALANVLRGEYPQTAAVVIAQLPPERAALVLEQLPASLATEALERMAWLDEIAPEIVADLARVLRQRLAPHLRAAAVDASSLAHLKAVLDAMGGRQRQRAVQRLAERNTSLGERLGVRSTAPSTDSKESERVASYRYRLAPLQRERSVAIAAESSFRPAAAESWLAFDDLATLDDAMLRTVFAAAEPTTALLALTGAEPRLLTRVLGHLPAGQAAVLRDRLEHPGAIRLRDIDAARRELAAIASRLAREGTIELPESARFAAAV